MRGSGLTSTTGNLIQVVGPIWGTRVFRADMLDYLKGDDFFDFDEEDLDEESFWVTDGMLGIVITPRHVSQSPIGSFWEKVLFCDGRVGYISTEDLIVKQ